mgnify:CR=1 FL=1
MAASVACLLADSFLLQGKGTLQDDGEALLTGFVAYFAQQPSVKVRYALLQSQMCA